MRIFEIKRKIQQGANLINAKTPKKGSGKIKIPKGRKMVIKKSIKDNNVHK